MYKKETVCLHHIYFNSDDMSLCTQVVSAAPGSQKYNQKYTGRIQGQAVMLRRHHRDLGNLLMTDIRN